MPTAPDFARNKGVNFVYRHVYIDSISATYVIDPNAGDPSSMLGASTSAASKQRRKNLYLQSECGPIDADVWILDTEAERAQVIKQDPNVQNKPKKVLLGFRTTFGSITVKLVCIIRAPLMTLDLFHHT